MSTTVSYEDVRAKFETFHQNDINVLVHLFTTQIGVLATMALANKCIGRVWIVPILAYYVLALVPVVPHAGTVLLTALVFGSSWIGSVLFEKRLRPFTCAFMIGFAYFGQDAAHMLTGEATYQSSYSGGEGKHVDLSNLSRWVDMFYEHCYFQIPLVVDLVVSTFLGAKHMAAFDHSAIASCLSWASANSWIVAIVWYGCLRAFGGISFSSSSSSSPPPPIRVYTDMVGDLFHKGHFNLIITARREAQAKHPNRKIWVAVGVHSDDLVISYKRRPIMTMQERADAILGSKLADAVYLNAPMGITEAFMDGVGPFNAGGHKIDYVAGGDDGGFAMADETRERLKKCKAPKGSKIRLKLEKELEEHIKHDEQYKVPKDRNAFIPVAYTKCVSTTELIRRVATRGRAGSFEKIIGSG
eukprot:g3203.t1